VSGCGIQKEEAEKEKRIAQIDIPILCNNYGMKSLLGNRWGKTKLEEVKMCTNPPCPGSSA
jgi:hypothetical protein